jgi:hypothetical protein
MRTSCIAFRNRVGIALNKRSCLQCFECEVSIEGIVDCDLTGAQEDEGSI